MSQLYHLAYISKNTIPGGRSEVEAQIRQILEVAHTNNPSKNGDVPVDVELFVKGGVAFPEP